MVPPQFFYLSPIKGLSSVHMGFSPAFAWKVELEPGLVWRTVRREDGDLFERFWEIHQSVIAPAERFQLGRADTWLAGEATNEEALRQTHAQIISFAVAASLHHGAAIQTRFMIFETRNDGPIPGRHSSYEDWVRTTRLRTWRQSVLVEEEENRERLRRTFQYVRRAFHAPEDHAFLRAVGRYRGAVFSQFIEAMAILLCASLEALGKLDDGPGQPQVLRRLVPKYSKNEGVEKEVLKQLYDLRHVSAHGLIHELGTRERRVEALDLGFALTRLIVQNALADDELYAEASKGSDAMKKYLGR